MKRVLHVLKGMDIGGIESFIINMNREFVNKGIYFDYYLWTDDSTYYENEIRELGGRIFRTKFSPNPIINIIRFISFLKKNHYNVVHCHSLFYCSFFSIACKMAGVKNFISHIHSKADIKDSSFIRKFYANFSKFVMLKLSTYCLACSKEAALYGYGKITKKVIILNDFIDVKKYLNPSSKVKVLKKKYELTDEEIVIGTVGRLSPEKNQKFIIDVLIELKKHNQKFYKKTKCLFVGDGPEKDELINYAKKNNVNNKIIFTGNVSNVEDYLHCMNIFLFPSKYEGFGMALLEAQAAGIYCLSSNNVPRMTDMNLNIVEYISLDDLNLWMSKVLNYKTFIISKSDILNKISIKGFDISSAINIMELLYSGNYKKNKE